MAWIIIHLAVTGATMVSSARASERTHQLSISVVVPTDVLKFERIASARYHVRFRRIVAADIDRDGDLDVVAATEHGFMVWMNDGVGHLQRQIPRRTPSAAGRTAERTWGSDGARREESLQNDAPSATVITVRGHDPPPDRSGLRSLAGSPAPSDATRSTPLPRAPPA